MIGKKDIIGMELCIEDTFKDPVLSCHIAHKNMIGQLLKVVEYHSNKDYVYVETIEGETNRQIFPKSFIVDQHRKYNKTIEQLVEEVKELNRQIWKQKT
jgi:hypothetical protein